MVVSTSVSYLNHGQTLENLRTQGKSRSISRPKDLVLKRLCCGRQWLCLEHSRCILNDIFETICRKPGYFFTVRVWFTALVINMHVLLVWYCWVLLIVSSKLQRPRCVQVKGTTDIDMTISCALSTQQHSISITCVLHDFSFNSRSTVWVQWVRTKDVAIYSST